MKDQNDRSISRSEIYIADLNPVRGSEQGGVRPVLIIQNDVGNKKSPTVIVSPITSRLKKHYLPTHIFLPSLHGLPEKSMVLLEHIRTIDKSRLKSYLSRLDDDVMDYIDNALGISVGLDHHEKIVEERPDEMLLCLCPTCAAQFYNSPDHIIRRIDPFQDAKEDCSYCNVRKGYDYRVICKKKRLGDDMV